MAFPPLTQFTNNLAQTWPLRQININAMVDSILVLTSHFNTTFLGMYYTIIYIYIYIYIAFERERERERDGCDTCFITLWVLRLKYYSFINCVYMVGVSTIIWGEFGFNLIWNMTVLMCNLCLFKFSTFMALLSTVQAFLE